MGLLLLKQQLAQDRVVAFTSAAGEDQFPWLCIQQGRKAFTGILQEVSCASTELMGA